MELKVTELTGLYDSKRIIFCGIEHRRKPQKNLSLGSKHE